MASDDSWQDQHTVVDTLASMFKNVRLLGGFGGSQSHEHHEPQPSLSKCPARRIPSPRNTCPSSPSWPTSIPKHLQSSYNNNNNFNHSLTSSGSSLYTSDSLCLSESFDSNVNNNLCDSEDEDFELQENGKGSEDNLPIYTLDQVGQHDMMHDCWIVLYDKVRSFVYDINIYIFAELYIFFIKDSEFLIHTYVVFYNTLHFL